MRSQTSGPACKYSRREPLCPDRVTPVDLIDPRLPPLPRADFHLPLDSRLGPAEMQGLTAANEEPLRFRQLVGSLFSFPHARESRVRGPVPIPLSFCEGFGPESGPFSSQNGS